MTLAALFIELLAADPLRFFSVVFTVVVSIILHELAHGLCAIRLGDRTPIETGHMSPDPLVHMGPWAIGALLIAGIAWGQMPIDPHRLRGRHGEALVALAGPAMNLLLAVVALTALGGWASAALEPLAADGAGPQTLHQFVFGRHREGPPMMRNLPMLVFVFGSTNLALCLFNLLPVPPLDGAHVAASFHRGYERLIGDPQKQGVLLFLFIGAFLLGGWLFSEAIGWSMQYVAWCAV